MAFLDSQNRFAAALLDPAAALPEGVVCARGTADPARFAVYRNNVHVSLTRALAQRFPVTERLVGTDFFTGMARVYVGTHKPTSPLIMDYGEDFPDFIADFAPAAALAYLPDVARIEAGYTRAYHAADRAPLDLAPLAAMPQEVLGDCRLVAHPAAWLLRSDHPAGTIWSAHQAETVTLISAWEAEAVLVVRPALRVAVHVLPVQDGLFAALVLGGMSLAEAAQAALAADPRFDFGSALVGLIGLGAFCALETHLKE